MSLLIDQLPPAVSPAYIDTGDLIAISRMGLNYKAFILIGIGPNCLVQLDINGDLPDLPLGNGIVFNPVSSSNDTLNNTLNAISENNLTNPMEFLGDIIYGGIDGAPLALNANITNVSQYLRSLGDGTDGAAPTWSQIAFNELFGIPTLQQVTFESVEVIVTSGAGDIDCTSGNLFYASIIADTTFTLVGMLDGQVIGLSATSAGASAVIFYPPVKWANGLQPPQTNAGTDVYTIEYINGIYYAAVLQAFA